METPHDPVLHGQDRPRVEVHEQVHVPGLDRKREAAGDVVDVGGVLFLHERPVTQADIAGRGRPVGHVGAGVAVGIRLVPGVVVQAPGAHDALPTGSPYMLAVPARVARVAHDEPELFLGVKRRVHERLARDVRPFAVARELGAPDERHIVEVVLEPPEGGLVFDPVRLPVFEHIHAGVVRGLHQRPIGTPEVDREVGLVEVPVLRVAFAADAAGKGLRVDRGHAHTVALVGRAIGGRDGRSVVRRFLGVAFVESQVDVVTG